MGFGFGSILSGGSGGGLTSVGLTMPSAFSVANSPLVANGTIAVSGSGTPSQYVRGDGQLATFPTNIGGGSAVNYYLNGGTLQGNFLGQNYYEMNKTAVIGTDADFSIGANGYIGYFITDGNDPQLPFIPNGAWQFQLYFSSSSSLGTPNFYVEIYKYDGVNFTLISDNSSTPQPITGGTIIEPYSTLVAMPQTPLALTDRIAIRVYVQTSGQTITLHTQGTNICKITTTFSYGIVSINGLTDQVQYLQTGNSGTDFNINSVGDNHTFNLPTASALNTGKLSNTDWTTFNNKQNALTFGNLTESTSSVLTISGGTGSVIGAGTTIEVKQASGVQSGFLSSSDWTTFNNKQNALTFGNLTEATSSVLIISGGTGSVIGAGTSIQVQQASATQSGFLSSADWVAFNGGVTTAVNFGSTQWTTVAPSTILPSGQIANGFAFFTDLGSKSLSGTTAYDEYFIWAGRKLTLTGTSGTANINILGVDYLATFTTDLTTTANNFVTSYQATLLALGVQVFANTGVLKFGRVSDPSGGSAVLTAITITTVSGTLSGTFDTAINDHCVVPYQGKPYFGERLNHIIRINFNIDTGSNNEYSLTLRRWQNDTQIGSEIIVTRSTTLTGQQEIFVSFTAGATDPFVTGGFYFALRNPTANNVTISGSAGILIETFYQKPTSF